MLKKLSLVVLSLTCFAAVQAAEVSHERAAATATALMADRVAGFDGKVLSVKTVYYESRKAYHVVQFVPAGWMLISADDLSDPLIGYSPDGTYPTDEEMPENMQGMMNWYGDQVVHNAVQQGRRHVGWDLASRPAMARRPASSSKVEPLIKVNWNQTGSYQKYCPKNSQGQAIVGCVAVGMAQSMSVAKWPDRPVGKYGYDHPDFGNIYVDYDAEPAYDWNAILSGANNRDDVARLLYHCGVSVRMDYGIDGSGSQTVRVANALVTYFKYPKTSVRFYSRDGFSDAEWASMIQTELQEGRSVTYAGNDPVKRYGHCFNIDGFDGTSAYHLNWGWGGVGNAYFQLNGLKDAAMDMNYTNGHEMVIGIRAPSEKPSNITLSNRTVQAMKPAGTVVGTVTVESEAENPTYAFKVVGPYSIILHRNMSAPFKVVDDQLVTTEELSVENGDREIEITATNQQNGASVTRHFTIHVSGTDGITMTETGSALVGDESYSLSGQRTAAGVKGISLIRQRMSDGSYKTIKNVKK